MFYSRARHNSFVILEQPELGSSRYYTTERWLARFRIKWHPTDVVAKHVVQFNTVG